jgi:endonuclease YncB( thermonuclease family)
MTAGAFLLGAVGTAVVAPVLRPSAGSAATSFSVAPAPARPVATTTEYPAEVLQVIDGDTFEARVHLWPGLDITTRVRLRGIDAPEMHARCTGERRWAELARDALRAMLAEGAVGISEVALDKYGGRVDAAVTSAHTGNVAAALLAGGYARDYRGGRRGSWCDASRG